MGGATALQSGMGIMQSLRRVDQRVARTRRDDESQRDYLARLGDRRVEIYVPREVYAELVDLHDKVAALEATVARLQEERQPH
jgi:hypothetical protein